MSIVRVALDLPLPQLFDYLAPDASTEDIGYRVSVPFGRNERIGIILDWLDASDQPVDKLKSATAILRDMPRLPDTWLRLCEFCSRYYQAPIGEVTSFALPPMLRRGKLPKLPRAKKIKPDKIKPEPVSATVAPAVTTDICAEHAPPHRPPLLMAQQEAVRQIIQADTFQTFLLHGVTGSGKTEVYLHAIAAALVRGEQALMLVPEIALTPQLEGRVRTRFPQAHLVVANSSVSDAARARGFLEALASTADIVLGTRLAVFTPMPRLRLIIVDEEHDASFKQQDGVRYSARDLAIWRAHQHNCPIVLGSATPSLESFHHANAGRYRLLALPDRAVAEAPPVVRAVDTRREKLQEGLSAALITAIEQRLARGEQSLVFLNRRGYAPVLACAACGWISRCQHCAANMVVHLADKHLRCHHCGGACAIPHACPDCGNIDIHPFGRGTQRVEAALIERFPDARVLRVDRDSANNPKKWQALLASIHAGEVDILIGTQMLAKGHDFPKLTLVGAISADTALFAADFRAPERLFSQLMQVGGRSGRANLPGEVLIQTEHPAHPLYQALIDHDYARFAKSQLDERKTAGFPPFTFQAMLRAESPAMGDTVAFLMQAREAAEQVALHIIGHPITLFDPVPMRLHRLMAQERAQLLVESGNRPALQHFLAAWQPALHALKRHRKVRWHVDVDPLEF
ncbi:MAG: primosomal protein N' [Rugosibacter sp.]|jgi:primosomal protein N' (replication factor Y)|nr:primosomal protein N' (replication factor Y) (superfamily II helicase) [Rugosibacter sp.]